MNKNMQSQSTAADKKWIKDLSVHYLYFLCVFMEKSFQTLKKANLNSHSKIEFSNILRKDFLEACEKIEVVSATTINETITYKDIEINFCERFKGFVSKKPSELRNEIFNDLKYLSYFYFGIILTERDINVEPIIEYIDSIKFNFHNSHNNASLFKCDTVSLCSTEYSNAYSKDFNKLAPETIEIHNKIGFNLANSILVPELENLNILSQTHFDYIIEGSNHFLNCFYQTLQNEYLMNHINNILKMKNINNIQDYFESNSDTQFVSILDTEKLFEND